MSNGYSDGNYTQRTRHRHVVHAHIEFTGANGANPADASIRDQSGVIRKLADGTRVERTAEGIYKIHLRNNWKAVSGSAGVLGSTGLAGITERDLTAGSNSVSIRVVGTAGTADDQDAKVIFADLLLSNSDDL